MARQFFPNISLFHKTQVASNTAWERRVSRESRSPGREVRSGVVCWVRRVEEEDRFSPACPPLPSSFAASGCSFIQQRLTEEAVMWKEGVG